MSHHHHESNCGPECDHTDEESDEIDFPEPTPEEIFGPVVPSEPIALQAGPVSLSFDPDWAILRRFMVDEREALRAIYPAVRSSKWKTAPPRLSHLTVKTDPDSFRISFDCEHVDHESGVDFAWHGEITGEKNGTVRYAFEGAARSAMQTNRTGLCVLHPILPTAGQPVGVERVGGGLSETSFPALISPHQPFFDVAALIHEATPREPVHVAFEGDTFETEDQRNWTDASFKTYGGALSKPIPLNFPAGHPVRQSVTFSIKPWPRVPVSAKSQTPIQVILPAAPTTPLPSIGTRFAPEVATLDESVLQAWRALKPGHLLVDVDLTAASWPESLRQGQGWAAALKIPLLLRVIFTPNHQPALAALAQAVSDTACPLLAISVVNPGEPCPGAVTLGLVAAAFQPVAPFVPIAAAPADNFADMNRHRPPPTFWAAPPMCPQVHTFDHQSIMENIEAQPAMLATARSFNPHPLLVGPVALLRRRIPDPRQSSLFAAAWTAGSLATVLPLGLAAAVTYHEHAGPIGIPGTPCEGVFEGLANATRTAATHVSHPSEVTALTVFTAEGARSVLLVNLTRNTIEIGLDGTNGDVFEFGPYATAWIDA